MKNLKLLVLFFVGFLASFVFIDPVSAKEIDLTISRDYFIETSESIRVVEKHIIKNNSQTNLIDKNNTDKFIISHLKSNVDNLKKSVESAKILIDGVERDFTVEYDEEVAILSVKFPRNIGRNDDMVFELQYQNYGLIETTGALIDIYASGISEDSLSKNPNQGLTFRTNINILKGVFGDTNFVLPNQYKFLENEQYSTYTFEQDSLIGRSLWIQLGTKQYYKFKIVQKANANNNLNLPFNNEYKILLPRDIDGAEIYQKIQIENMLPLPKGIEKDPDGNLFAYFDHPMNQSGDILLEGYVEVGINSEKVTEQNSGSLNDYDQNEVSKYLAEAEFWEVNATDIQRLAKELKADETNVYRIIKKTYEFVVDKIDYSKIKKFGINERIGALKTLNNGSGVCMEYSDLFLTLLRAQGVPARAVFGFGYDPLIDADKQEPHQWVQVLIPGLNKWLDVDITWGENGEASVGGALNHFYTHIAWQSPEEHSEVVLTGVSVNDSDLSLPTYDINAVKEIPSNIDSMNQDELVATYPFKPNSEVVTFLSKLPQNVYNFLGNFSENEVLSIVAFTIGFTLLLFPILYKYRDKINFGGSKNNQSTEIEKEFVIKATSEQQY